MTQQDFFNRYTYSPSTDRVGGGGFGTVYKAKDNVLHRMVAIKVSEVKTTADGKKTFSLKDEFEALSHVPKHPNIANYEEFCSFEMPNGVFDYAIMQYYPDGNLANAICQGLTADQKEDIAVQLLKGIDFLHQHNVVHRDLKPGNILIVRDGNRIIPLITDFGLSKSANAGDGSVFSNSFGGGTQRYSSPEQLQGKPLRFNTDLWSYGSILYELFTGEQLFSAGSGAANSAQADLEIYNKIVNGNVRSFGGLPEKWRRVAERCLVVDPDQRVKGVSELLPLVEKGGSAPMYNPQPDSGPSLIQDETEYDGSKQQALRFANTGPSPVAHAANATIVDKYPNAKFIRNPKRSFIPLWFWMTLPFQLLAIYGSIGALLIVLWVIYHKRRKAIKNCFVEETQDKFARISDFYKVGLYNKRTMRKILPIIYDGIVKVEPGVYIVEKNGKVGAYRKRKFFIPLQYDRIKLKKDGIYEAISGSNTRYYTKDGPIS